MLPLRQLGSSDLQISPVGVGSAPMGSTPDWFVYWGPQAEDASIRTIHAALDVGINWIDTAPCYGWGRAETVVGNALKGRRDKAYIFTKAGIYNDPGKRVIVDLRPESLKTEIEGSLQRLQTDHVDLYQFHEPDPSVPIEESWGAVQELIKEGKVRHGGLSNHSAELIARAMTVGPVVSLQDQYSLLARRVEETSLPFVHANSIGFLAWSPLASGFLVDGFDLETLDANDFRRGRALAKEPNATPLKVLRAKLAEIAGDLGCSMAELSLAWLLNNPAVKAAIVGMQSPDEPAPAVRATSLTLSDSVKSAIQAALDEYPLPPPTR
ncbi:MAG: aldo/keto reductase [Armatimonadetes bacterium]|nr:aldo/keto reductase [Armatimonadota bacterium]